MTWLAQKLKLWWLQRQANAAILFKRVPEAVRAYREILEVDPRNELAGLMLGNLLAEAGDREGAVAQLEKLTVVNPSFADAWFNLGYLHDQADRLTDAERCFRRAVELRPSLDRAWYGLGLVLIRDGRLTEAVDALKQTIKLQPFSPYGYYQLGLTYHHLGRKRGRLACPQAAGRIRTEVFCDAEARSRADGAAGSSRNQRKLPTQGGNDRRRHLTQGDRSPLRREHATHRKA